MAGLVLISSQSSVASEYTFKYKIGVSANKPTEEAIGPDFWMKTGVDIAGKLPVYSDNSSTGNGKAIFNFGQKPFAGDPLGYQPYDKNYDSSLWKGSFVFQGDVIYPSSLNNARYGKTYYSGKYYFEVYVSSASWADSTGFTVDKAGMIGPDEATFFGVSYIGSYLSYIYKREDGEYTQWSKNYNVLAGDTIQVWVDFDNGNLLVKKLNSKKEDHIIQ